ncbi:acyl-CoA N-acyltransferase [Lipomyces oligophaga]|uniref:acyl-CoA N-acyltransferase n=1 Tax=Lipomyces oligophaga TaxID=45792 RepID=UPI0034CF4A11
MEIRYRKYEPPSTGGSGGGNDVGVKCTPKNQDVRVGEPLPSPSDSAEKDLDAIRKLIANELSEPYGIYVYRYFIYQWPDLCFLALADNPDTRDNNEVVGVIVCQLAPHRQVKLRGYIAMLAVTSAYRHHGIAKKLVSLALSGMQESGADEVVLEAEVENVAALRLYENMGFIRYKRMHRYYMNSSDAFRLILPLTDKSATRYCVLASEGQPLYPTDNKSMNV